MLGPERICPEEDIGLFDPNNNRTKDVVHFIFNATRIYSQYHKYICVIICPIGILANVIHFSVLLRRPMRRYAINRLLTLMAVCDILLIISYLIFNIRFGIFVDDSRPDFGFPWPWICFLFFHIVCTYALHAVSLYLSVTTAYIRFHAMHRGASKWLLSKSAGSLFMLILSIVLVTSVPSIFVHDVIRIPPQFSRNRSLFAIEIRKITTSNHCFLFKANLWLTAIVFRVIPCILLMFFTVAFIKRLYVRQRKHNLLIPSPHFDHLKPLIMFQDRTTKMLLVLLLTFLIAEVPQGVIAIMSGLYPNEVFAYIYFSFGEMLDLLTLLECFVCFIVYALISSHYRENFRAMFGCSKQSQPVMQDVFEFRSRASRVTLSSSSKRDAEKSCSATITADPDIYQCRKASVNLFFT